MTDSREWVWTGEKYPAVVRVLAAGEQAADGADINHRECAVEIWSPGNTDGVVLMGEKKELKALLRRALRDLEPLTADGGRKLG